MGFLTLDIGGSGIKIVEYNNNLEKIFYKKINSSKTDEKERREEFHLLEKQAFFEICSKYPIKSFKEIYVSNCGTFDKDTYIVERWNRNYYLLSDLKKEGYKCKVLNDGLAHPYSLIKNEYITGPVLSITFGTGIGYAAFDDNLNIYSPCITDDIIRDHRIDDDFPDKDPHELLGFREMMNLWKSNNFDKWCRRFINLLNSLFANIQPKTLLLFGGITNEDYEEGYKILNSKIIPLISETYYYKKKGLNIKIGEDYSANLGVIKYFNK